VALISGGGAVAVNPLVNLTAFEEHADVTAIAGLAGAYLGLGYITLAAGAFDPLITNL